MHRAAWIAFLAAVLAGPRDVVAVSHVFTANLVAASGESAVSGLGVVVSTPAAIDCQPTCQVLVEEGTQLVLTVNPPPGKVFAGWSSAPYAEDACMRGSCRILMATQKNASALFVDRVSGPTPYAWFRNVGFNDTTINTTSVARVYLVNAGDAPFTISGVTTAYGPYVGTAHCPVLASGEGCDIEVAFKPTAEGFVAGSLLRVNTSVGDLDLYPGGRGVRSLVPHFYVSTLRRQPDFAGRDFWNDEHTRIVNLGADVNEVWFAMAQVFYGSPEYLGFNRNDADFVTDLYRTFFNRAPEQSGLDYWMGNIQGGMPREVALATFMFSPEFASFTSAIFGNTAARAEVDTVMDFYRGLLARLPDYSGFNFWVGRVRTAQCQGTAAVNAQVEAISSAFALSAEYAARAHTNAQYVGDLYNAFLRRGGDLSGVQFWINDLNTGARTRESVRQAFVASPEFQNRVAQVIAQGCL